MRQVSTWPQGYSLPFRALGFPTTVASVGAIIVIVSSIPFIAGAPFAAAIFAGISGIPITFTTVGVPSIITC